MADAAYENALAKRHWLKGEILKLEEHLSAYRSELAKVEKFLADWAEFAAAVPVDISVETSEGVRAIFQVKAKPGKRGASRPKNPSKETVAAEVRDILLTIGRPMRRSELFEALADCGIKLHGTDPEMVLSTMLWRMSDKIVRLGGHGYWPADVTNEKYGYIVLSEAIEEHRHIKSELELALLNHNFGNASMDDQVYDQLKQRLVVLENMRPELVPVGEVRLDNALD